MSIKILICQNIKHNCTYSKKYRYINKPVFVFIVILSSLIMYAKLGSISGGDQAYLDKSHRYTQFLEADLGLL